MMFVLLHVVIALSSIVYTSYLFISPTKRNFQVTYALIGLTLASGTYLVISKPAHIMSACESGLAYIGVVLFGLIAAQYRLVHSKTYIDRNKTD